jgi:peroxiredoxin
METLKSQIDEFRAKFREMASQEKIKIIENGIATQKLNRGLDGLAKVGDVVLDFNFLDNRGELIQLSQLLKSGPLVFSFYRGGWCPYCNLELRAYESILPKIQSLGANVIALSPEKNENMQSTSQKNNLSFSTGTDEGLRIAKSLGLVFELSAELKELYSKFGHALSDTNSEGLWELPIPATFVIEPNYRITFAYTNLDYRERLEPSQVLEHLSRRERK